MIAADTATVAELNRRARRDRVADGCVTEEGVDASAGQTVGVGDEIITRQNDRTLSAGRGWVKNGDRWTVTATWKDGRMEVRRTTGGPEVKLPAAYVAEHVELAYASTAMSATQSWFWVWCWNETASGGTFIVVSGRLGAVWGKPVRRGVSSEVCRSV